MIYEAEVIIINPETYKAISQDFQISLDYVPDYEDIVKEFFHQWNQADKYTTCYAIGVKSMNLHDNTN